VREFAAREGAPVVVVCAALEAEMVDMDDADKQAFLADLGQSEPGLDRLIRAAYELLGLETYFTAGVKEVTRLDNSPRQYRAPGGRSYPYGFRTRVYPRRGHRL